MITPAVKALITLKVKQLYEAGIEQMPMSKLWEYLAPEKKGISQGDLCPLLTTLGLQGSEGICYFTYCDVLLAPAGKPVAPPTTYHAS